MCQAEEAIFPVVFPRWFNRSANKYLWAQQCSSGGWQPASASGIDGDQRGFPQDDCKGTLPLSDCVPALCGAHHPPPHTRESCVGSEVLQTSLMTGCGSSTMFELLILSQFVTPAHYRAESPCPQPPLSGFVLFAQVMETCSGRGGGQGNICDRWKQWELNTFMILLIGKDEGWVAAVNNTQSCTLKHPHHSLQSPAPSHRCHQPPSAVSCVSFQKYLRQGIFRSHCKRSFASWLPTPPPHFNGSWQLFKHQLW